MPQFEYDLSAGDFQLVANQQDGVFDTSAVSTDYIRLTVFPTEALDNAVGVFYASPSIVGIYINITPFEGLSDKGNVQSRLVGSVYNDFKIYQNGDDIYIKPNEIFNSVDLPQGGYRFKIDFLNQLNPENVENVDLSTLPFPEYFEEFDINSNGSINVADAVAWVNIGRPDIYDYLIELVNTNATNSIPSIYDESEPGGQGGSTPQPRPFSDFYLPGVTEETGLVYDFIVRQISTSRTEIRLKLKDSKLEKDSSIINYIISQFHNNESETIDDGTGNQIPNPNYKYQFKHLLNIGTGDHIPIMNYLFDNVSTGKEDQSLILKLYEPLPLSVGNLSFVSIEKEVLTTQFEDTYYFSDIAEQYFGDGLVPQSKQNYLNSDGQDFDFQNYDELSGSIGDITLDNLISSSYEYPNLNTDYTQFENHTFFGSAKKKLENFKTKIETIQGYYSDISKSLSSTGQSIQTSSVFLTEHRKELFKKINDEIRTFTPYERFLYYDGQSESTASAPGLGKNYVDTIPVQNDYNEFDDYVGEIPNADGFNTAYHHSSQNMGLDTSVSLFTGKYLAHEKPFFNYSSSIYLSFLMKADSGSLGHSDGRLRFDNRQTDNYGQNVRFTSGSKMLQEVQNPSRNPSKYQRYIFHTSHSYWIPTPAVGNDLAGLLEESDFNINSSNVEILSGSIKTGSNQILDSSGKYASYVTVNSESIGIPFLGSVKPSGDLFPIKYHNTLTSSLQGFLNFDTFTSGALVTDDMMLSASAEGSGTLDNPGPIGGGSSPFSSVTISDGVEVHGRQYGKSIQFVSESRHELDFDDSTFNFGRDDNFSLSIWAKRFHPDTASADGTQHGGSGSTNIFGRGLTTVSYGITYEQGANRIRAGVRGNTTSGGGSTQEAVTHDFDDDLLDWHHIVFTFQSGSATGLLLYVDGNNVASGPTLGDNYSITGSDFTASNYPNEPLAVGGNEIIGGNQAFFSGFLQYPRVYDRTITADEVKQLYLTPPGIVESKITDVKVSLNNPSDVLPFDNIYHTSSNAWNDWYNGTLDSASAFDTNNIHSFENNLPLYIQDSSDYQDMKDFLNLQGEQYDLIRNHIDSMGTIHKRGYEKTDSPPDNTLPMLLSNIGWEAINPFSGSLNDSLGQYLTGVTSIDDIKNSTWRKTLNNLLYIYKTKGTNNSIRALLNTYGYPPDVIKFKEFGGTSQFNIGGPDGAVVPVVNDELPDVQIETTDLTQFPSVDLNLLNQSGSFSFVTSKAKFYRYLHLHQPSRILNLDWWMDSADINTIEFVYKHRATTQTQTILESSGSGAESLWDLRLIPGGSGLSSSFQFRLNNSLTGSLPINTNGISMSLAYDKMTDGQLWNVMLQRMTGSSTGRGTVEYRLHAALQNVLKPEQIKSYNFTSMSISGGLTGGTDTPGKTFNANKNWQSSGSRHYLSSSNLFVGETFSGSIAEIKAWTTSLSSSRFRQHVFNKFSSVGNSIDSSDKELTYHFKLNENYSSASVSSSVQELKIIDSAPKCNLKTDYSFTKPGTFFTSSLIYGLDIIDIVKFTLKDNVAQPTNTNIIINPNKTILSDLNANKSAVESMTSVKGKKPNVTVSKKLEINKSTTDFVNDFILNQIDGFSLENKYGDPTKYYSSSYSELDTFRKEFFDCNPIDINVNRFIKANENMFSENIVNALQSLVPAGSTFSDDDANIAIEIKPTILEKQKYEHKLNSIETNPNSGTGEIDFVSQTVIPSAIFNSIKEGTIQGAPTTSGSKLELPISTSISLGNAYVTNSGYVHPSVLQPSGYSGSIVNPYSASVSIPPSTTGSQIVNSFNGVVHYSTQSNQSFEDIHKNWGTGSDDTQFINFAGGTGSRGDYNVRHIDTRFYFYTIGDMEHYSGSNVSPLTRIDGDLFHTGSFSNTDFSNAKRFFNRMYVTKEIHKNVTYDSKNFTTGSSILNGRMMGKTRYFTTSSDGTITLPSNHITKFSYPFKKQMYKGAQNPSSGSKSAGFLNVQQEDYSSASFYRVKVTGGENEIRIVSGNPKIDNSDNVKY